MGECMRDCEMLRIQRVSQIQQGSEFKSYRQHILCYTDNVQDILDIEAAKKDLMFSLLKIAQNSPKVDQL